MSAYDINYCKEDGTVLDRIYHFSTLEYVKTVGDVGVCIIIIPQGLRKVYENNNPFKRIHIYRNSKLDFVGFVTMIQYNTDVNGNETTILTASTAEIFLRRRIAAYYSAQEPTATTHKEEAADDIMKDIATDNLVTNADYSGTPTQSRTISFITVQADSSAGPTVRKEFAWQNCLQTMQDLQAASKAAGTEVFFFFNSSGKGNLEFRTRTSEPGRSLIAGTTNQVVFSPAKGNLQNVSLTYDYSNEFNNVYALGEGANGETLVATSLDSGLANSSAVSLSEAATFGYGLSTTELTDAADDELARGRPKAILRAELLSVAGYRTDTIYGINWNLGDRVTIQYRNTTFNVIIRSVSVSVNADGHETITSTIEDLVYVTNTN